MYNDPTNPYDNQYPGYTGGTEDDNEVQGDPYGTPEGDGYWKLIGGVWRWITEPLARTAVTAT